MPLVYPWLHRRRLPSSLHTDVCAHALQMEYGAECHISKRPYTKFRWRPGSDARYKSTIICQEVARAKNVCQVCLLDLKHNLPVQVRDQMTNAVVEDIPESEVGLEYQLALKQSRGELGAQFQDKELAENDNLARLTRTTPYYKVRFDPGKSRRLLDLTALRLRSHYSVAFDRGVHHLAHLAPTMLRKE